MVLKWGAWRDGKRRGSTGEKVRKQHLEEKSTYHYDPFPKMQFRFNRIIQVHRFRLEDFDFYHDFCF